MTLKAKVYSLTSKIPKGKVTTYGTLAKAVGLKSARPVGHWMHVNPDWPHIPCHRVVNSQGKLAQNYGAPGKISTQAKRLRAEGVVVTKNRVDLKRYFWKP